MVTDVADPTAVMGNVPLLPACEEPLRVSHWPTLPATIPLRPVIVRKGELTVDPDVCGTHTPATFLPGLASIRPWPWMLCALAHSDPWPRAT